MRTITQIYEEMVAAKEAEPGLASLSSASRVAMWRLLFYTVASALYVQEVLFGLFQDEARALAATSPAGTPAWYHVQALAFQYGDVLTYADYRYAYPVLDAAKRIVARAAVQNRGDGLVLVKAAKLIQDAPAPLAPEELTAFEAYMALVKFAGTRLAVVSTAADQLVLRYDVYYDPQRPLVQLKLELASAVDAYLASLPFDAALNVTRLTDALQPILGVKDVVWRSGTSTPAGAPAVAIERQHVPSSGYFELITPISQSFTYIPLL